MKLTNTTLSTLSFVTGAKDGEAIADSIGPGETKTVNVRDDDPSLVAYVFAGAILIDGKAAATNKAVKATHAPAEHKHPE